MSTFPENWASVRIGDICNLINGRVFRPHEWSDSGLPIVRIQNLNRPDAPFHFFDGHVDKKHLIKTGDALFCWSGTPNTSFGAHVWTGDDAVLNQHIYKLEYDRECLIAEFLALAINDKLGELIQSARGAAGLRHVTKSTVQGTRILIAPLEQQTSIVLRLRQTTDRLRSARSALDRAITLVREYRQAIIDLTCNSHRVASLTSFSSEEWIQQHLGNVIDDGPANGWSPKSGPDATGALTLRLSATSRGQMQLDQRTTKRIYVHLTTTPSTGFSLATYWSKGQIRCPIWERPQYLKDRVIGIYIQI